MREVALKTVNLPDFGLPQTEPQIPAAVYEARIAAAREKAAQAGYDVLLVYGDREHYANLAYLTGYDPRFEEALLILTPDRLPVLLVGNEGLSYSEASPVTLQRVLYQSFSLPGQPRGSSPPLDAILREAGIADGQLVGLAGWKYFDAREADNYTHWSEVPAFIVETLAVVTGSRSRVLNAGALFMDPVEGLRTINEVEQLAVFEFASTHTSGAMRNLIFGLLPGMTEYEAVRLMGLNGMPLSAHLMFSSGPRAWRGLSSPSIRVVERGDPVFLAYGLWGALNARGGWLAESADELPEGIRDYVEKLVAPYFRAIVEWYEAVGIGVEGGLLYEIIHRHLGDPFFGVGLNPGHLIHLDEWLNSPIYEGSTLKLRSGMAIQVDVIPATHSPWFTTNIEDGIALADEALRAAFAARYPEAWARIQARRAFMQDVLGIRLRPEVLPFSSIPAYLPPFWLAPQQAMVVNRA